MKTKDKSALCIGARFVVTKCAVHAGKGSRVKRLTVYACARAADGERASGYVCAEHAPALLALSSNAPSLCCANCGDYSHVLAQDVFAAAYRIDNLPTPNNEDNE